MCIFTSHDTVIWLGKHSVRSVQRITISASTACEHSVWYSTIQDTYAHAAQPQEEVPSLLIALLKHSVRVAGGLHPGRQCSE